MSRFHTTWDNKQKKQVNVFFTPEEEAARDAEESAFEANKQKKVILDTINTLEKSITPRRFREATLNITTDGVNGKDWLTVVNNNIAAERAKL